MPVEIDDTNGNSRQSQQGAPFSESYERKGSTQGAQPQQPERPSWSFRRMGGVFSTNIPRTPLAENLVNLDKKFAELYKTFEADLEVRRLPFDVNVVTEIGSSLLVIAVRRPRAVENSQRVAYHTLILDGTALGDFQPKIENWQGQNYEISKLPTDTWDKRLREFVATEVARAFNVSLEDLIEMDAMVVPRDFDPADPKNESFIKMIAANALLADNTELESTQPDFPVLSLRDSQHDSVLTSRFLANDTPTYDILGEPVVADVTVKLSAGAKDQNGGDPGRVMDVAIVSGKMDLLWDPAAPQGMAQGAAYTGFATQAPPPQKYRPHFIISNLENTQLQTIEAQLLALSQALMLRQDDVWTHAFRPRPYQDAHHDIHDIGVLGIEAMLQIDEATGLGLRIDTKSERFKTEQFMTTLRLLIQPGLRISLDVSEAGPSTWFNSPIMHAAMGSVGANREMIRGANALTDGNFDIVYKRLGGSGRVADWLETRVHLGKFLAPDGKIRDIRDIGYIEIANMTLDKDPSILQEWSNSFQATNIPRQVRESMRKRILSKLFDPTFTGYAVRCTFEAKFLDALGEACHMAGLALRPVFPYSDFTKHERASAQYAGSVLTGVSTQGLFSGGFGTPTGTQSGAYRTHSRWGA